MIQNEPHKSIWNRWYRSFICFVSATVLIFLFQNCSNGFDAQLIEQSTSLSTDETETSTSTDEDSIIIAPSTPIAPQEPVVEPPAPPTVPVVSVSTLCGEEKFLRQITVTNSASLQAALDQVKAGDLIFIADGKYLGQFTAFAKGTLSSRITLCGSSKAVLDGGTRSTGYGFHLKGDYWNLVGFTVRNSQKGIMLDASNYNRIRKVTVADLGAEGIHFRAHSSYNILHDSVIKNTGLVSAGFGEGVYVGSAGSNWCRHTNCVADKSNFNKILRNHISQTRAESIDVKEGTTGTLIEANQFDGTLINGANSADSWVDVKGNDVIVRNNVGRNAGKGMLDGYQTHVNVPDTGQRPLFENNDSEVNGNGFSINIHSKTLGYLVGCNNNHPKSSSGLSNKKCVVVSN